MDPRRVRALVLSVLEDATEEGDTLRSQARVVQEIRDQPLQPGCPVSPDIMGVVAEALPPEVETTTMADGSAAYQLARLADARRLIARQVTRRRGAARLPVTADWKRVIDEAIGGTSPAGDDEEELARREKAAALEMLATSRVSVLVGAAGTGKTTLLRALASIPEVAGGGLLLLAPTGKARVRMQDVIGSASSATAQTLAQLLIKDGRYDHRTNRYQRSDRDRRHSARTVIVDECSMLTEEALDALLDGIEGFDRLILVGDPRQLPPIGAGRPFVDIVQYLRNQCGSLGFPRVGPSYAELTIPRRHTDTAQDGERADLLLAEWFAGGEPSPAADEIWDRLGRERDLPTVSLRPWSTPAELGTLLRGALADALPQMSAADDSRGFQLSYGGTQAGDYMYFNIGAAAGAEAWQVLSPVRASAGGVSELNRMLQRSYREGMLALARNENRFTRRIPKPAGPEEIVYGDKVINIRNKTRRHYYPKLPGVLEYVANGEIGVVTGPFKGRGKNIPLDRLEVEFTTQKGTGYKFWMNELGGDDDASVLELAYAVTVHKSQGSEFGQTFVILPNPCRVMSRELLYTALTRQRDHVTLLTQGQLADLRQYASAAHSETASRITNLFTAPSPVEVDGRYLEAGLIHHALKGHAVRSKSELTIADRLFSNKIDYQYEQPLDMPDGTRRLPDFTVIDDTTGTSYYWEHLGMLQRPSYRRQWQRKLAWYRSHGILPHDEGGGPNGTLIITQDGDDGSISSPQIQTLIDELFTLSAVTMRQELTTERSGPDLALRTSDEPVLGRIPDLDRYSLSGSGYDGALTAPLRWTARSSGHLVPAIRQVRVEPLKPADPAELGGIVLRGRLGRGGMGTVYYGITPDGEPVAVKVIREDLVEKSEARGRFDREALAIGMVQGPRVANLVTTSRPDENRQWFAVEYVRGLTLSEYVTEYGALPAELGAALGIGLAEALAAIHEAGILHRDLKPSNILLGKDGPKVIDFGLAALTATPGDLTRTDETIGTPVCMSPEQVNSAKDLTTAADVYSLGAVLVFALTAHYPYERPTVPATLYAIADAATPPDLAGVPEILVGPVVGMLAHAPATRPALSEVTVALTKVLADPVGGLRRLAEATYQERPTDPPPADPPRARRPRLPQDPRVPSVLIQRVARQPPP